VLARRSARGDFEEGVIIEQIIPSSAGAEFWYEVCFDAGDNEGEELPAVWLQKLPVRTSRQRKRAK
jgi:hypothetical protein